MSLFPSNEVQNALANRARNAADAPYTNGPVSLRDNAAGFYATQTEPLVIEVHEDAGQEVQLAVSSEGFLALDGEGGLRDLVLVGEEQGAGRSGFSLEPREGGERLYNVTWGGQGRWYVQSIGDDNYQLKWWDGELDPACLSFLRAACEWVLLTLCRRGLHRCDRVPGAARRQAHGTGLRAPVSTRGRASVLEIYTSLKVKT